MGKAFIIFGILFLLLGITIIFNTFQGLTGFAIYEDVDINKGFLFGAWFVLTGILLAVYRKNKK
ncbi:MAG: hypothetical protein Q7S27_00200 [Nanoarchaeota archaeon]|nr:hypothetical protein [Nanoarchaeota archaeon]